MRISPAEDGSRVPPRRIGQAKGRDTPAGGNRVCRECVTAGRPGRPVERAHGPWAGTGSKGAEELADCRVDAAGQVVVIRGGEGGGAGGLPRARRGLLRAGRLLRGWGRRLAEDAAPAEGWRRLGVRRPLGTAAEGTSGGGGSQRTKIALLASAGVGVLVVAGVTIGTLGASSGNAGHATTVSDRHSSAAQGRDGPAAPGGLGDRGRHDHRHRRCRPGPGHAVRAAGRHLTAAGHRPAGPGPGGRARTLTFTPATPFWPGTGFRVTLAGGTSASGPRPAGCWPRDPAVHHPPAGPTCGSSRCWPSWATCR